MSVGKEERLVSKTKHYRQQHQSFQNGTNPDPSIGFLYVSTSELHLACNSRLFIVDIEVEGAAKMILATSTVARVVGGRSSLQFLFPRFKFHGTCIPEGPKCDINSFSLGAIDQELTTLTFPASAMVLGLQPVDGGNCVVGQPYLLVAVTDNLAAHKQRFRPLE